MKNTILTTLVFVLAFNTLANSQALNQNANWPNEDWSLSGNYASPFLYENPTVSEGSESFSYDDDDAGSASINNIAVESPVVNLFQAYNAAEFNITVAFEYTLNIFANETLRLQYWDNASSLWVDWDVALSENITADSNYCASNSSSYNSSVLNISAFSSAQLEGFRYRIYYNDNTSYGYGFCVSSVNISSAQILACPDPLNLSVLNINTTQADVRWNIGSSETEWEIKIQLATEPTPTTGTYTLSRSHRFPDLVPNTNYRVYVRANCEVEGFSNWESKNFTTGVNDSGNPTSFTPNPISTGGVYDIGVVDLNGDFLDDIVSISSTMINVRYQLPNGGYNNTFITTPNTDYSPNWSFAVGDFDANGFNDLLYAGGSGVTFMKANETGTDYTEFSGPDYVFSQRSNFIDINNDGHLDAFVCHDIDPNVYYINDGSGNLTFYQGESTGVVPNGLGLTPGGGNYGTVWIDFDNDRDLDMFIAKCRGGSTTISTNELWRNDGNGVFVNVADSNGWYNTNYPGVGHNNSSNLGDNVQTWSSAWADFDNDGDMDVFVGASSTTNGDSKLMQNNGDGTFTDITSGSGVIGASLGIENAPADFDNDGYVDIMTNGDILFNNGDFTFTNSPNSTPSNGAIGDINNDGFLDVFQAGVIHVNNTNDNNWIKINTVGMGHVIPNLTNRNGIGARVEITTNSGTQIRDVRSGEGFEFMSSLNTHFGLGAETSIDNITIYWPSGTIDYIPNPTINTTLNIIEGSAPLSIIDETLSDILIYPNPVKGELNIKTQGNIIDKIASIFDVNGKRVINLKLSTQTIDVSSLQNGIYFLRLESNGRSITQKFIKK